MDDSSTRVIDASIVAVDTLFSFNASNATLVADDVVGIVKLDVTRATVTRITADLAQSLLDGKPDLDAIFERPANETQFFNGIAGAMGTYQLSYNGELSSADPALLLSETSTAADVKAALESISGIREASVSGDGTSQSQWRIELIDADVDSKQNYYAIGVTDPMLASTPLDISDNAATTRQSISLANPAEYQRVYYDRTAEIVDIRGGLGDDTFISDDSMAAMVVSGDEGADNFLIGRVIKTKTVEIDGRMIDVVDGEDGLTPGVSFNAAFFRRRQRRLLRGQPQRRRTRAVRRGRRRHLLPESTAAGARESGGWYDLERNRGRLDHGRRR